MADYLIDEGKNKIEGLNKTAINEALQALNTALSGKADATAVNEALQAINTALNGKADATAVNEALQALTTALNGKADATAVNEALQALNTALNGKADATAVNEALQTIRTALSVVQNDLESLNNNGYISTIDEYVWSTTSKNVTFNGRKGKTYTVAVTSLDDLNTSSRALYAIRSDNSYQVISNNITVGEYYEFTATDDFVYVRIYLAYSTPPTNNKVKYAIGLKGYCKTEIDALKVDTLKNTESIETLNEHGELDYSGSYIWSSSNKDIPFNGKNGTKYVVIINSIGNTNYNDFVIYAMRANNTYQTVKLNPYIGERCEFTATADFVKIRFSVTYSTPPSGNVIAYTIGISGYIYSAISEIKADKKLLAGYPDNIVCIGDSLTDGYVKDNVATVYLSYYNYPYFLGKIMNTISSKIAQSGYTTKDIWDNYENEIRAVSNSLVVVWLGTNGGLTDTVDTDCAGDDISNYANTNTGYYGRIINTLLSNNNKVVLAYIFAGGSTIGVATTNNAIKSLATRFNTQKIELNGNDIAEFKEEKYHTSEQGYVDATHFSCIGYSFVARSFYGKLEELAKENPSWFCMKKTQS